jgi:cyclopropane fatty-acyl-phospholipid synthase-like methyltransferase
MGCGFGEFLKYLTGKSVSCSGIDSNAAHVKMCNELGLITQVGDILDCQMSNKFQNVILDNVLEHLSLSEIERFFLNLRNILSPKGRLVAIVPCQKGQSRDPTHKTYVTKELILDFSSRHRMELVEVVNLPTPFEFVGKFFYLQMRMFVLDLKE